MSFAGNPAAWLPLLLLLSSPLSFSLIYVLLLPLSLLFAQLSLGIGDPKKKDKLPGRDSLLLLFSNQAVRKFPEK